MSQRSRPDSGPRAQDLADYLAFGAAEGLDPHPLFDTAFYMRNRPDLVHAFSEGLAALVHYRQHGAAEGMNPHPLFDTRFYLKQCPESLRPDSDPLCHYILTGWREGLDPHPLFSTTHYLQNSPDVASAGMNPLLHYVQAGAREDRATSPWFDSRDYLRRYPEVQASGMLPLVHFVCIGAERGYIPSPLMAFHLHNLPDYQRPGGAIALAADDEDSYLAWVRAGDRLPSVWRARTATQIAAYRYRPTVSLLLHVNQDGASLALTTLRSVLDQVYQDWQLSVVLDLTLSAHAVKAFSDPPFADPRINVIRRGTAVEPAFALNTALDLAVGDYTGLVGCGSRLHPLALAALVGRLQGERRPALVYGDEDCIDDAGRHTRPLFKPDWSPDLMLGQDYICRGSLFRTRLLRDLGGFRPGFDTGIDYDLALRLLAALEHQIVQHVPHPLYHRHIRATDASRPAVQARNDGMYRALKAHIEASGFKSTVVRGASPGHFRTAFEPKGTPSVSAVIPTANARFAGSDGEEAVLENCVRSLRDRTAWPHIEIIVVHDGNLAPEQVTWLEAQDVKLVYYDNPVFNFSQKINLGARAATGDYILVLNDDVEAKRPDWLRQLMGWVQQPGVGVVGPKLFFPDGRLQHVGIVVQHGNPGHPYYRASGTDPGHAEMNHTPRNWLAVTGACQLVSRRVFDAVGGYDENLPLNFNDVDFCMRILAQGLRSVFVPQAELYHFEGITKLVEVGNQLTTRYETDYFQAKWRAKYATDPFYHPDMPAWQPIGLCKPDDVRRTPSEARKIVPALAASATTLGVNWLGPFNRSSGLGTAARGYLSALQGLGVPTRLVPLDKLFGHQARSRHTLKNTQQDFPITIVHGNADLTEPLFDHYGDELARARYRIGVWVWELPAVRSEWFKAARLYDEIWVPSTFNQTAFKAITAVPVTVIPYALPELPALGAADRAATRAAFDLPEDAFIFFYMFDTYSFIDRKNPNALLDAFEAEFAGRPDVVLLLKISYFENLRTDYSPANHALLRRLENIEERMPNIIVITEILPHADVCGLINATDCYVSPHRSEGFGLTVAEAMFYGKPVIATDFGGTTDFVRDGVGFPLSYKLIELEEDRGPYARGNVWADPSVEHLRALMVQLQGDAALCRSVGAAAAAQVRATTSPTAVGRLMRRRLKAIAGTLDR